MSLNQVERDFQAAVRHHTAGQLRQADALYRKVLARQPKHADALHHLGVLALQVGQTAAALEMVRRAVALKPEAAEFHNTLGEALRRGGDASGAIQAFERALQLKPRYAEAHFNMGITLLGQDSAAAEAALRRAAECGGESGAIDNMLGVALARQEKYAEAIEAFARAVQQQPQLSDGWANLAAAYERAGRLEDAIDAGRRAVAIQPQHQQARFNLGVSLQRAERFDEAVGHLEAAVRLRPNDVSALNNLGVCYTRLHRWEQALAELGRARALSPRHPETLTNLATVYLHLQKSALAESLARAALEARAEYPEALHVLGRALRNLNRLSEAIVILEQCAQRDDGAEVLNNLAMAYQDAARLDEAERAFRRALARKPDSSVIHSNLLLSLHYNTGHSAQEIFSEHVEWDRRHAAPMRGAEVTHVNAPDPHRRLRIGYVSCDFRRHSVNYFIEPVLAHHDRTQFEVFCYSDDLWPDRQTEVLRSHADAWRPIKGISDAQVADLIRGDEIDIVIELAGHTGYNRLLAMARKPAPILVTYLGYPDTTGLRAMDYRLTDELADPIGQTERFNSEKLMRFGGSTAWCYAPPEESLDIARQPRQQDARICFGCFNSISKVNQEVVELWSRILVALPNSRLMIKSSSAGVLSDFRQRFYERGVTPEQLEMLDKVDSFRAHLALYSRMDISLDPFPYAGTTTTCEALWMGVPVVTLAGRTHAARVGVSLMTSVRLPELIAHTPDDYVRIAVELARDEARLRELGLSLRERMRASRLTDGRTFTHNLELMYREMWRRYCSAATAPTPPA